MKLPCDLIVFDLETNGEDIPDQRITQIGAVRLEPENMKETSSFSAHADGRPLSRKSIEITGITEEMCSMQPQFVVVGRRFDKWVEDGGYLYMLAAWGTYYDIPGLRHEYRRAGLKYPFMGKALCIKSTTFDFFWNLDVPVSRCSVDKALTMLGLEFDGKAHDGLDDARNTARIYRVISGKEPPGRGARIEVLRWYDKLIGKDKKMATVIKAPPVIRVRFDAPTSKIHVEISDSKRIGASDNGLHVMLYKAGELSISQAAIDQLVRCGELPSGEIALTFCKDDCILWKKDFAGRSEFDVDLKDVSVHGSAKRWLKKLSTIEE
jgi:DNA polymerase III epsilon subunit-like protein